MTAPDPTTGTDPQAGHAEQTNWDHYLSRGNADEGKSESGLSPEALRAELKRARDEAAKYRQRARENSDAKSKLDEIEQSKKSELERLTEEKEGLLHRASSAEDGLMRLRVALGAGVSPDRADEFASRLRGDTEEDLKADAEQLARFFGASSAPPRRGDPSQGAGRDSQPSVDPIQAALEGKLGIPR